jgi:c(7)-type cytochrome triheme protein
MAIKRSTVERLIALCIGLCIVQVIWAAEPNFKAAPLWLPLTKDGLHDPAMTELRLLQNPGDALSILPREGSGNQVNWTKALEKGYIKPHVNIRSNSNIKELDLDVLLKNTGEMDMVLFPHKQHTEWLACSNCHEEIFKSKAGANKFGMFEILNGEYCGRCHSSVAFPLTECKRCHTVPRPPFVIRPEAH